MKLISYVFNMIKYGKLSTDVDDGVNAYTAKVDTRTGNTNVQVVFPYGYYSKAPAGSLSIVYNISSDENNQMITPFSTTDRWVDIETNETIVGNTDKKTFIKFDKDGGVEIESTNGISLNGNDKEITLSTKGDSAIIKMSADGKVDISGASGITLTGFITINGNLFVDGNIEATGTITP